MRRTTSWAAVLLAGCLTSGGNGGDAHGGTRIANAFFGGGRAPAVATPGQGSPGRVAVGSDDATCQGACAALVACVGDICGVELTARQTRNGEAACEMKCDTEAVRDELEDAVEATTQECAGARTVATDEALCDDLTAEDFDDEPKPPAQPSGGDDGRGSNNAHEGGEQGKVDEEADPQARLRLPADAGAATE